MKRFIGNHTSTITYLVLFGISLLTFFVTHSMSGDIKLPIYWYISPIIMIVSLCLFFISREYEKNNESNVESIDKSEDKSEDKEVPVTIETKEKIDNLIKAYWLSEHRTVETPDKGYVSHIFSATFNDYIITIPNSIDIRMHKNISVSHKDGTVVFQEVLDNDTYEKVKEGIFGEYQRNIEEKEKRKKQKEIDKFNKLLNQ